MLVAFVGSVDIELQIADRVQLIHRNAMALEARGGSFRAGDCAIECRLVFSQRINKAIGRGAGADAHNAFVIELRKDEVDSCLGDCLFELILGHAGSTVPDVGKKRGYVKKVRIIAATAPQSPVIRMVVFRCAE
ncbi:Unknown protein sequence [Pseudomonas meliae]|uniref:Uncharacterized protein n=1 Tax=Pseudomonas meliae TaxID=86176 RepID=A0A0P9VUC8_9PSED|nr:Unknown protein sequence [Pseudomonas meliae]